MKIVIVGGKSVAGYLIKRFSNKRNRIIYITMDENYARFINREYEIDTYIGDGTSPDVLENAKISGFDVMITLCPTDEDNLVACRLAKTFGVKRTLSIVNTPSNANLLRELLVDTTISIADLISMVVEKNAFTQHIETLLPIENGKALMMEIEIEDGFMAAGKEIRQIEFPQESAISCIIRNGDVVIPKGNTVVRVKDRLMIITLGSARQKVIRAVTDVE